MLVVCTANVCRSPHAEYIIERAFQRAPGFADLRVGSAGLRPVPRGQICERVRQAYGDEPEWPAFDAEHLSLRATPTRIEQARLILTASRTNRAAIATRSPSARSRTFTLREALWLGEGYRRPEGLFGAEALDAFARHLHGQRGIATPARRGWFRRDRDPLSIQDGHSMKSRAHDATIRQIHDVAEAVSRLIVGD